METVKVQDITPNDLPWKIRYDASRCTLCGSCVATCSFRAIEAKVERRRMVFSEGDFPEPKQRFSALPVIRRVHSLKNYCRGCGCCEKVGGGHEPHDLRECRELVSRGRGLVDPATANTGGENETEVNNNIKDSFRAFEDPDGSGSDDDD